MLLRRERELRSAACRIKEMESSRRENSVAQRAPTPPNNIKISRAAASASLRACISYVLKQAPKAL